MRARNGRKGGIRQAAGHDAAARTAEVAFPAVRASGRGRPDRYGVPEFPLEPGDRLIFDSPTVHGVPDPKPPSCSIRRFTLRFADGAARYRPRGPWTADMTEFLERRYGLVEGGPCLCDLLPILWR